MERSKRGIPPTETAFPHQLLISHQECPSQLTQIEYYLCHLAFGFAIVPVSLPQTRSSLHT